MSVCVYCFCFFGSDVKKVQWTFDSEAENERQKTAMCMMLIL
ncbi:MAG: hypothetical protein Q4D03_09425 [Bacteroidales bacterium]|nr:hypothetical protein [Bacteroidales bacterium]